VFKLGVITDEIYSDVSKAVEVARDLNLECVELRGLWDKNVKDLTDNEIRKTRRIIRAADMKVSCISSPFFKCNITDEKEVQEHLRFLPRVIEIAKSFDTDLVRVFSFWKTGTLNQFWNTIVERLKEAIDICRSEGITLVLENEYGTFIGKGDEARRIIETLNSKKLRINWDPGNALCAGEVPYPNGYREAKDYMVHMHMKDAIVDPATGKPNFVAVGKGEIDYVAQFRALVDDGYDGCISIETHYQLAGSGEKSTRETWEGICGILSRLNIKI
jgi:sugar phosphate isomerase/epimerase